MEDDRGGIGGRPSLNLAYDVTDTLKIRGAATETLARPEYGQLAENSSASISGTGPTATASETISNPNLKPRKSANFDVSTEWYWAPGALASVAVFNKQIQDEIETLTTTTDNVIVPGLSTPVSQLTTTTSENAGNAVIQGVELDVADVKFDFLPGFLADFGGSANVSFITFDAPDIRMADGSFRQLPQLLYSSRTIENFALLYSRGPYSGQIVYNYTSKMPISFDTNNKVNDQWWNGISTVDGSSNTRSPTIWRCASRAKTSSNSRPQKVVGLTQQLNYSTLENGHAVYLGVGVSVLRWLAAALMFACAIAGGPAAATPHRLFVLSVDGLDWRYLRDRDALGLSIPHLRHLLAIGEVADGVIGVWPTITWPSHTSIITGARPDQHGILSNARGAVNSALSYWSANKLNVPTLWQCAGAHGLTTAAITWPVTMDAKITYNLPEVFVRRNGGSMDLDTIAAHATPGLVDAMPKPIRHFPSNGWTTARARWPRSIFCVRGHPICCWSISSTWIPNPTTAARSAAMPMRSWSGPTT